MKHRAVGVYLLPEPPRNAARTVAYPHYLLELFAQLGLCHLPLTDLGSALDDFAVIVTIGEGKLPAALTDWVADGGCWLAIGGTGGWGELLGVAPAAPSFTGWASGVRSLGEGYAVGDGFPLPLHFFGGLATTALPETNVLAHALDSHQRPTPFVALTERAVGAGYAAFCAVDLTGTIVSIQQGRPITRDGVPAPDGTGPCNDGVLKSDDGQVLDWHFDRQPIPGIDGLSGFLEPIADAWRVVLERLVLRACQRAGVAVRLLWPWPEHLPAVAHLSHDTDGNDPALADTLLATLAALGIHSTWCTILPGYVPERMRQIAAAGHELAMHYDALDHPWGEAEFDRQWQGLRALFEGHPILSNKNHYLRWQNDTEFFDWCQRRGIRLDQSKGTSKSGESGFNFGTCHPYRPVAPDGSIYPLWELPTPTQDLEVFAPKALLAPLLAAALRYNGVLHLLFHPAHMGKPPVVAALQEAVRAAQDAGLPWWTAAQLADWCAARRAAHWRPDGTLENAPAGATVLQLTPDGSGAHAHRGFHFDEVEP